MRGRATWVAHHCWVLFRITVVVTVAMVLLAIPYRLCRERFADSTETAPARPHYTVTEMRLPGFESSELTAISEQGIAVGEAWNGSSCTAHFQPFVWKGGNIKPLLLPQQFVSAVPFGCNDQGVITGIAFREDGSVWGIAWKDDGRLTMLLRLQNSDTMCRTVNRDGTIIGTYMASGTLRAFQFANKKFTPLGDFYAMDIDASGSVIGWDAQNNASVLWRKGQGEKLPAPTGYAAAQAMAMDDHGTIAGVAISAKATYRPCVWTNGKPALIGGENGGVMSLNNGGQMVGVTIEDGDFRAALWKNGKYIDLSKAISPEDKATFLFARGINDRGQIVGVGMNATDNALRGYLLTP